ncbi:MAG: hypothetical protein Q9191_008240, partial [Dirinaria sp. TL-2023a]
MVYEPLQYSSQPAQWLWDKVREISEFAGVALGDIPGLARLGIESPLTLNITSQPTVKFSKKAGLISEKWLQDAFERMKWNLMEHCFVPRKFHPRNADFEPDKDSPNHPMVEVIVIKEVKTFTSSSSTRFRNPEAYSIKVDEDGRAIIEITSPQGGLHALETFSQLFFTHSQTSTELYSPYAPVLIRDSPEFEHRGLNLDISRNWIPPDDVMRTIDAMAATKLNHLHLHAVDAQSWPLEIPSLPDLAIKGAYDPSQIWTTADLENVQRYGSDRGVEIFIEIDLPGHTRAIGYAYPDLIVAGDKEPWSEFALEPPAGQLKLNSSEVRDFLKILLDDLLPRTSRWSSKLHIGGDELNTHLYTLDPTVRSSSPTVLQPLLQSFLDHVLSITESHNIQPIVWEEMSLEWNLTLPKPVTVQTWRSASALNAVLAKGHRALFGSNSHWYLDCGAGSFLDPNPHLEKDPHPSDQDRSSVKPPYLDYCTPYKNWRHIYSYNPLDGVLPEHRHLIAGGEVHLWGELTDRVSLDGTLWPRAAAAAEVMWSLPRKLADKDTTRRLAEWRERMVARGIGAGMVQMEWCL